ncbi:hypothetical protein HZA98_00505 [Candidatus Woesearchaeota archaeon]|nr:hypothetical protein [Candidatus Woesearchaeota archaeon]
MRKGQFTLAAVLGIFIILAVIFVFFLLGQSKINTAGELASIDNIVKANTAVHECLLSLEKDSLFAMGYHGGYVVLPYRETAFDTSTSILSVADMEANLQSSLEAEYASCAQDLEGSGFAVSWNRNAVVQVDLGHPVLITIASPGKVYEINNEANSMLLEDAELQENLDFSSLYGIVQEQYAEDMLIENYAGYQVNNSWSADYGSVLYQVRVESDAFVFRVGRVL